MRNFFISSLVIIFISSTSPILAADSNNQGDDKLDIPPENVPRPSVMTSEEMVKILVAAADDSKVARNMVQLNYKGIQLLCIYDVSHDRMRIISSVAARGDITEEQFEKAMEANFHTALDARYALNKGILYSAFIHPLSTLTKVQIESALIQTATLAATFGKQYSSGFLKFGGVGQSL